MSVVVTDGMETQDAPRGVDDSGAVHTAPVLYRDLLVRQALAGQGMSGFGFTPVTPEGVVIPGGFLLRSEGDHVGMVTYSYEERSDGALGLWVWTTINGSAHWDVPEGWSGEAPIATSMPWLRVSR